MTQTASKPLTSELLEKLLARQTAMLKEKEQAEKKKQGTPRLSRCRCE